MSKSFVGSSVLSEWKAHKDTWKSCRKCPLAKTRSSVVFYRGKIPCDILLIGEAPGPTEDVIGRPFVGRSGKLLDEILDQVNEAFPESQIPQYAITNIVSCYPGKDEQDKIMPPPKIAIEKCVPKLEEFIEIAYPKGIVFVGKVSSKNFDMAWYPDIPYVSVVHPAYILRQSAGKRDVTMMDAVVTIRELLFHCLYGVPLP